jgi:hypothetical protein
MRKNIVIIVLLLISFFFMTQNMILTNELKMSEANLIVTEQKFNDSIQSLNEQKANANALTEWDMFTLALMKVESNYVMSAVSSAGARGYFQFMPIYVKEVNRIHGTNYKFDEVVNSFEQSYEVFTLMQKAKNKNFSMDKALTLHNGTHEWYHRRVYDEMKKIKRYEQMRQKVQDASRLEQI